MSNKVRDFTSGSPGKQLLLFSWPLILSMILQNLYNLADTWVIGHYLGDVPMGAIGTCGSITNVVFLLMTGITMGMSVIASQYIGAKKEESVRRTTLTGLYMIAALAVLLGVFGYLFAEPLLKMIQVTDGETLGYAEPYLKIIFAGTLATAMYNMGNSMSRALGDSITPMITLIVTSILNVALNILFVAAFHMGVAGVGYANATVIATVISAVVCWAILWKKYPVVRPTKKQPDRTVKLQ